MSSAWCFSVDDVSTYFNRSSIVDINSYGTSDILGKCKSLNLKMCIVCSSKKAYEFWCKLQKPDAKGFTCLYLCLNVMCHSLETCSLSLSYIHDAETTVLKFRLLFIHAMKFFDRAVSLSGTSAICRNTVGAWSGLTGQVAWGTEGSCSVIGDRWAQRCPRLSATTHDAERWLVFHILTCQSVCFSWVCQRSAQPTLHRDTNTRVLVIAVLYFPVLVSHSGGFLCLHLFLLRFCLPTTALLCLPLCLFNWLQFQL